MYGKLGDGVDKAPFLPVPPPARDLSKPDGPSSPTKPKPKQVAAEGKDVSEIQPPEIDNARCELPLFVRLFGC